MNLAKDEKGGTLKYIQKLGWNSESGSDVKGDDVGGHKIKVILHYSVAVNAAIVYAVVRREIQAEVLGCELERL